MTSVKMILALAVIVSLGLSSSVEARQDDPKPRIKPVDPSPKIAPVDPVQPAVPVHPVVPVTPTPPSCGVPQTCPPAVCQPSSCCHRGRGRARRRCSCAVNYSNICDPSGSTCAGTSGAYPGLDIPGGIVNPGPGLGQPDGVVR